MTWQERAACAHAVADGIAQPEDWFADDRQAQLVPLSICRQCPVTAECLRWRTRVGATHGIWGGLPVSPNRRASTYTSEHKECPQCGELFARQTRESRYQFEHQRRYCSNQCRRAAHRDRERL